MISPRSERACQMDNVIQMFKDAVKDVPAATSRSELTMTLNGQQIHLIMEGTSAEGAIEIVMDVCHRLISAESATAK